MTLIQLRYLMAIINADLNISVAATKVNATQPGISKQLKQLEDELGFQIFVRRGKSLDRLSESGAQVVERARTILTEMENIRAIAANHRDDSRGLLRLATTPTQSRFVLPAALLRLKKRYPDVAVRLSPTGEIEAPAMLERDEADLAVISTSGERPNGDIAIPLYTWDRVLIAPRAHALASLDRPLSVEDLAEAPLVTYESALRADSSIAQMLRVHGLSPNLACTTRDAETIKTCVRSGLGLGLVAEMALTPADVDLVTVPTDLTLPRCTSWAVLRRDRVQRNYLFELLSVLAPHLSREQVHALLSGREASELGVRSPSWRRIVQDLGRISRDTQRLKARLVLVNNDDGAANAA